MPTKVRERAERRLRLPHCIAFIIVFEARLNTANDETGIFGEPVRQMCWPEVVPYVRIGCPNRRRSGSDSRSIRYHTHLKSSKGQHRGTTSSSPEAPPTVAFASVRHRRGHVSRQTSRQRSGQNSIATAIAVHRAALPLARVSVPVVARRFLRRSAMVLLHRHHDQQRHPLEFISYRLPALTFQI